MNLRAMAVAVGAVLTVFGLFVAASGPLRSFFGDVVIVVFLVSAVAAVGVGTTRSRLIGVGVFAVLVEALQGLHLVGPDAHWLLHLTVGSTADPLDLLAYGLGLVVAAAAERWYQGSR